MNISFRLRHLQSVSVRNLVLKYEDINHSLIFFVLSTKDENRLKYFYQSVKCDDLLNPVWESFDLSFESIKRFSFLDNFVIVFFIENNNKNKIIAEISVHISGLSPFYTLSSCYSKKDENIFLFQFNGNLYSFDNNNPSLKTHSDTYSSINVKMTKQLYNNTTINKFLYILSENYQQQILAINAEKRNFESQILDRKYKIRVLNDRRNIIISIRNQIQLAKKNLDGNQKKLFQIRLSLVLLKEKIDLVLVNSQKIGIDISKNKRLLRNSKDKYVKISNGYLFRMYKLINEFSKIFPITPTDLYRPSLSKPKLSAYDDQTKTVVINGADRLSIVDLYLPISDKQNMFTQDASSFAALGIVYQLLNALSLVYDIPLRYPLIAEFDKTMVRDNIIDINDNLRNFVLIKNSSENFRLQYGIYLLNMNIIAIRGYFSLSTKYPDRTLWNLSTLIEGKNRILPSSDNGLSTKAIRSVNNSPAPDSRTNAPNNSMTTIHSSSSMLIKQTPRN